MKKNKKLAKVYHYDLYGKRDEKYKFLVENSINSVEWNELDIREPDFYFANKNYEGISVYKKGFLIEGLFQVKAAGIKTHRDGIVIGFNIKELERQIENYLLTFDNSYDSFTESKIKSITYRPFDTRLIYFDTNLIVRHREKQIKHSFKRNISLVLGRQTKNKGINHFFISNTITEMKTSESSTGSYQYQLYLYPEAGEQSTLDQSGIEPKGRTPNLDMKLVSEIAKGIGLEFRDVTGDDIAGSVSRDESFAPLDILDYIYAVLHSPAYREKYKEFLKIDFPRVPYPKDKKKFWQLVDLGSEIRLLHLLETADKYITSYPNDGSNIVERKMTKNSIGYEQAGDGIGRVWINDEQYFDGVPAVAWEFYIGGYQPAQKWLKDRVGRELNFEDINHYQKIIVALTETDRLMKEVDSVGVE